MIPLNRVVAFLGPYISVVAGGIAAWLVAKVNALGVQGLDQENLATQVGAGLTFTVTTLLAWLGQSKWLRGHQIDMQAEASKQVALLQVPAEPPDRAHPPMTPLAGDVSGATREMMPWHDRPDDLLDDDDEDADALTDDLDGLVGDDDEFEDQPPDDTNTPVQPSQDPDDEPEQP